MTNMKHIYDPTSYNSWNFVYTFGFFNFFILCVESTWRTDLLYKQADIGNLLQRDPYAPEHWKMKGQLEVNYTP